eukprot:scaffold55444_cov70-Phaeocystis_antarctica.AAC.1
MEQTDSLQDIMYTVTGPDTRVKVSSEHKGLEEACRRRDRRAAHDAMDTSHGAKRAQRAGMEHMPINSARRGGAGVHFLSATQRLGWVWSGEWSGWGTKGWMDVRPRLSRAPILVLDHARVVQVSPPAQVQPSRVRKAHACPGPRRRATAAALHVRAEA